MGELTKLQESILVLASITAQVEWALTSFKKPEQFMDNDLKRTVCNHIQILVCSYLEEWRRLQNMGADDNIRKTLYCAEPAISRLKKWKGLHKIRSQFLVHPLRDKRGKFVPPAETYSSYNAPTAYAETLAMGTYVLYASHVILKKRHGRDYKLTKHLLKPQEIPDRGFHTLKEVNTESRKVSQEISQRLREIEK